MADAKAQEAAEQALGEHHEQVFRGLQVSRGLHPGPDHLRDHLGADHHELPQDLPDADRLVMCVEALDRRFSNAAKK